MPSVKKMVLDWRGNYRFIAKNEKGLSVSFDAPLLNGGEETALSPMGNVLASLAACSSYHVLSILRKKRQDFSDYSVEMTADRRDEPPRVFTNIHLRYIVIFHGASPLASLFPARGLDRYDGKNLPLRSAG